MSNFYTDYELPIITVRTKFYPRKTASHHFYNKHSPPSFRSLEKTIKLTSHFLADNNLTALKNRTLMKKATIRG
jgi:hypothetical protein